MSNTNILNFLTPADLMFFNKIERLRDPKFTRSMYLPVSYERLMWQRSRLAEVIESACPSASEPLPQ